MIRVLYVDDEPLNLEIFKLSFINDFKITTTESPLEGLKLLDEDEIDVVVSDLRMPDLDGISFIKKIKEKRPKLNCILLTAFHEPQIRNNPETKGLLFKYILKPFSAKELKETVHNAYDASNH